MSYIHSYGKSVRRYHSGTSDGLLYAGPKGVQLTWMDAKVGNRVVTPQIGKLIEVNALWYNDLRVLSSFASLIGEEGVEFQKMGNDTLKRFQRFWNATKGYCFDVLDGPGGNDDALRPNQIFAVSLPSPSLNASSRSAKRLDMNKLKQQPPAGTSSSHCSNAPFPWRAERCGLAAYPMSARRSHGNSRRKTTWGEVPPILGKPVLTKSITRPI